MDIVSSLQGRKNNLSQSGWIKIHSITLCNLLCSTFTATTAVDFKLSFFDKDPFMVPLYTFPKAPWPSSSDIVTSSLFTSQASYASFCFCSWLLLFLLQHQFPMICSKNVQKRCVVRGQCDYLHLTNSKACHLNWKKQIHRLNIIGLKIPTGGDILVYNHYDDRGIELGSSEKQLQLSG